MRFPPSNVTTKVPLKYLFFNVNFRELPANYSENFYFVFLPLS